MGDFQEWKYDYGQEYYFPDHGTLFYGERGRPYQTMEAFGEALKGDKVVVIDQKRVQIPAVFFLDWETPVRKWFLEEALEERNDDLSMIWDVFVEFLYCDVANPYGGKWVEPDEWDMNMAEV